MTGKICMAALGLGLSVAVGVTGALAGEGGTIVIARDNDARFYDPHKMLSVTTSEMLPMLLDTLVAIDNDLTTLHPLLAKDWTVSDDGLTYTFNLRDDITFCSGRHLTAQDVADSFARWMSPDTNSSNNIVMGPLVSTEATGEYSVAFHLSERYSDFLTALAQPYAGIINIEEARELGEDFGTVHMDGTGPYCWGEWVPREKMVLKRHDAYSWGPDGIYDNKGPVKVDTLEFRLIPEANARISALLTGDAQLSFTIPASAIGSFRSDDNFGVASPRAFGWVAFVGMKIQRPLMADPAIRKAMTYAIDRQLLVDALYNGEADPAYSIISRGMAGYPEDLEPIMPTYDPDKAAQLLDEAGWVMVGDRREKDGVPLTINLVSYKQEIMEAVQQMMRDVGIDMQLELGQSAVTWPRVNSQQDFDTWLQWGSHNNLMELTGKYFPADQTISPYRFVPEEGAEIDEWIYKAKTAAADEDKFAALHEVQRLIYEKALWVPLVHEHMNVVYDKNVVTGVKAHGLGGNGLYKGLDLEVVAD